jgi:hypothetical protein
VTTGSAVWEPWTLFCLWTVLRISFFKGIRKNSFFSTKFEWSCVLLLARRIAVTRPSCVSLFVVTLFAFRWKERNLVEGKQTARPAHKTLSLLLSSTRISNTHTHTHTTTHPNTHRRTHTHTHTHTPKWLTWAATAHKVIPVFANVECQKREKTAKTQPDQILVFRDIHIKGVTLHLESASSSSRSSYSLHTGPEVTDTMCLPKKH